jgi:hypothetical protein
MLKEVVALTWTGLSFFTIPSWRMPFHRRIRESGTWAGELSASSENSPQKQAKLSGPWPPPGEDQLENVSDALRRRWWIARFSDDQDD